MTDTLTRRRLLQSTGLAAGALLAGRRGALWRGGADDDPAHVLSFIGEFDQTGAFVTSLLSGTTAATVDLAYGHAQDMSDAQLLGAQPLDPDTMLVRHDLAGLLSPASQYHAQLVVDGVPVGRVLSFRTQAADADPMDLRIALLSCQRNPDTADPQQRGWQVIADWSPDLLLHLGDFGYWGSTLTPQLPVAKHVEKYAHMMTSLPIMRGVLESTSSLIQVSDHEVGWNNSDTYDDPIDAVALQAYFALMPWRTFDDPTGRSRFLARQLGTNVLVIAPDFRSLDRSPGAWPDDENKTAYGTNQFGLLTAALQQPHPLKIILSDPGCSPADAPTDPSLPGLLDKWCNYQTAFQAMAQFIETQTTIIGTPINVDVWSGDRHLLGYLSAANNAWGPFDVLTSSGIDQHSLPMEPGETYDEVFGLRSTRPQTDERKTRVQQHMQIELTDDKAGTITRAMTGIDDLTGDVVVAHTKQWTYAV